MDNNDQQAIQSLFEKLAKVERQAPPRDPEAEAYIREQITRQPGAPYYMAQTILVQENALSIAERRIKELEEELETKHRVPAPAPQRGPWDREDRYDRGGGFLAGAAQTALGVTGGVLIGSAIASMFGGGTATATEPAPPITMPLAKTSSVLTRAFSGHVPCSANGRPMKRVSWPRMTFGAGP